MEIKQGIFWVAKNKRLIADMTLEEYIQSDLIGIGEQRKRNRKLMKLIHSIEVRKKIKEKAKSITV